MSALVMVCKGQRIDLTCQMKDADAVLNVFKECHIRFNKKYTSISGNAPSTITFTGVRAEEQMSDLAKMTATLHFMSQDKEIGNVYLKFIPKREEKDEKTPGTKEQKQKKRFGPEKEDAPEAVFSAKDQMEDGTDSWN